MDLYEKSLRAHEAHHGKLSISPLMKMDTVEDLSLAYTPGVAEPCRAIAQTPSDVYRYTSKSHMVAVITDGSAVLGLGNIGPEAALPVMEGKCLLFKKFGGIDAIPVCLDTQNVDEIVETIIRIAPGLGGINLEDIAAPRCFEIEKRLVRELDIPVFHDDQHGTAVVVLAGLINAMKVVGKDMSSVKIAMSGAGAAGVAIAKMLHAAGVRNIVMCDRKGIISKNREGLTAVKQALLSFTNPERIEGTLADAMKDADVFIGISAGGLVTEEMVKSMADKACIFAMANPDPEIMPDVAKAAGAMVVATGRSDFPNQINNVLAFPGIFKGTLEVRASKISMEMKVAAAEALAGMIESPTAEKIIPNVFDQGVADVVADAVKAHV